MQFASDYDSSSKNIVSGVLRVDATQWDRGKFECQVSYKRIYSNFLIKNLLSENQLQKTN